MARSPCAMLVAFVNSDFKMNFCRLCVISYGVLGGVLQVVSEQVGLSGQFVVVVVVVRRFCVLSWLCVANCLFAEMALNQVGDKLLLLRD